MAMMLTRVFFLKSKLNLTRTTSEPSENNFREVTTLEYTMVVLMVFGFPKGYFYLNPT